MLRDYLILIVLVLVLGYVLYMLLFLGLHALFMFVSNKYSRYWKVSLLPSKKDWVHAHVLWLLATGLALVIGLSTKESKAVAECTDCYYREPTIEELEFAERTWQEAWGQMNDQELLDGVVLELEAYQ